MRLYRLVEGQSEEAFVRRVLAPHLRALGIEATPIIVATRRDLSGGKWKGGGHWGKWKSDLQRLSGQHPGPDVRFTTMFDLYGLPDDFPGLAEHGAVTDTAVRAARLEESMQASMPEEWRLIPYLQRHEFEALVLAGLDLLAALLDPPDRAGIATLRAGFEGLLPEDVNGGSATAPSKRLLAAITSYRKTLHGPLVLEALGLAPLRAVCPRFDAWVSRLEKLA